MSQLLRVNALIGSTLLSAPLLAQETKDHPIVHDSFVDRLELITGGYWAATLVGTIALGLVVGYFVYRAGVAGGRAGSATGSGCLIAVLVFLAAQVVAVIVLITTVFSVPIQNQTPPEKPAATATTPTTTTTTGTTGTTTATTPTAPKTSTSGTTGDDF